MAAPEPTVESALLVMSGDNASGESLFSTFDVSVGHALAERVRNRQTLTGKQRRLAHRMLRRYVPELAQHGIAYLAIPEPVAEVDAAPQVQQATVAANAVRVSLERGRLAVRAPFKYKDLLKQLPGSRWNARDKCWTYPESPASAMNLRMAFQGTTQQWAPEAEALAAEAEEQQASEVHRDAEDLPPVPGDVMPSWQHQLQAYWFARTRQATALWMEMGTGKSKVTVNLLRESGAGRSLIVCPAKVLGVWPKQFRIHGPADRFHVVDGQVQMRSGDWVADSVEARTRMFDEALHECRCGKLHVCVINYEATAFEPFKSWALDQAWDYVVLDEGHRIRAAQGVWSKWCAKLRDHARQRLLLTGTMLGQGAYDAFAQVRFLDPGIFGTSYTSFEHRYFMKGGYGGYEILGMRPEMREDFDRRLFSVTMFVGEDVLDLPPVRDIERNCTLSPSARRTYKALDTEMFAELQGGGEVTSPNVLTKMLRLQQLTGGAIGTDEGTVETVDTSKQELLEEVCTDLDPNSPVVVFCRFVHDLDVVQAVAAKLKRPYAEVSGRRQDALDRESTLTATEGIVGVQIQAGGTGVDMTAAAVGIYYSLGFSLIDYKQSRRRLHRPGQAKHTMFVHLVSAGTIDEEVYESLRNNESVVDAIARRRLGRDAPGNASEDGGRLVVQTDEDLEQSVQLSALTGGF